MYLRNFTVRTKEEWRGNKLRRVLKISEHVLRCWWNCWIVWSLQWERNWTQISLHPLSFPKRAWQRLNIYLAGRSETRCIWWWWTVFLTAWKWFPWAPNTPSRVINRCFALLICKLWFPIENCVRHYSQAIILKDFSKAAKESSAYLQLLWNLGLAA